MAGYGKGASGASGMAGVQGATCAAGAPDVAPTSGSADTASEARGESRLTFYLPRPKKPRTALSVPGGHTLYVGPPSCMRRHDMHARQYGDRRNVSFLHITEADVISGHYEDLIVECVGTLRHVLDPAPRIFQIAVFCIDDFLGTDEDALINCLESTYPDCQFAVDHIDPVSIDETLAMGTRMHRNLYSFIKPLGSPEEHDRGVNFIGNYVSLDPACDFLTLLDDCGAGPVRELFTCKTYEDYQKMGHSCLTIAMRLATLGAAQDMQKRLGIPYYVFMPSIDADYIAHGYSDVVALLGEAGCDFSHEMDAVHEHAAETVRALEGKPIAIDATASFTPFAAARALLGYGFDVRWVFRSNHRFKLDPDAEEFIINECPRVSVARAEECASYYEGGHVQDCVALGIDGARVLGARHVVDMWHDEGYFGFQGIHRLMDEIAIASREEYDWANVLGLDAHRAKQARGER